MARNWKIQHSVVYHESGRFHGKELKITAFSGIPWNPADFMVKSGRFHEIWQISWNQANFMKSGGFHDKHLYTAYLACNRLIMYICIGSDQKYSIQWYTMKSGGFHEIQWISCMKSGRFHDKHLYTAYLACNRLIMYICIGSDQKYSIQW